MPLTRASTPTPTHPQLAARVAKPLMDAHAAGELLGVPHTWLLREARAERIPHRRLGRYVRWSQADIDAITEAGAYGPRTGTVPVSRKRKMR
jgi:predicted DNA-binding transcriptional regulator AlpA